MAYPSQINREMIIEAGWNLLQSEGVDGLSLGGVARRLDVTPQSLYRYVDGKAGLVKALNTLTVEQLFEAIVRAVGTAPDPLEEQVVAMCVAYREFAADYPHAYSMFMGKTAYDERPDEEYLDQLMLPLGAMMGELAGAEVSLPAVRGLLGLMHGLIELELAGMFYGGSDPMETFIQCVAVYVKGWQGWKERLGVMQPSELEGDEEDILEQ